MISDCAIGSGPLQPTLTGCEELLEALSSRLKIAKLHIFLTSLLMDC